MGGINEKNVTNLQKLPSVGVAVISAITTSQHLPMTIQTLQTKGVHHEN
ncbi:hypothetical protein [Fructilactobacillus ixorae]